MENQNPISFASPDLSSFSQLGVVMEDGEWVLVRKPAEKEFWNPTSMDLADTSKPLKVTFSGPAKHWTDAIPIGNGRLGAMVWGGIASETLQLNEDTLWSGVPGNYTNPNAPAALSEVRKLVDNGEYAEATKAAVKLSDNPSDVYQLLGDIKLEFDDSHIKYTEGTYHRELDLESATAIVTKISGSKPGSLSFTVSLDSKLHHSTQANGKNQIIMQGSCPGKRIPPKVSANDNPKGIQFAAVLDLQISQGGVVHSLDDKKLKVEGSDWAVMLLLSKTPKSNLKDVSVEMKKVKYSTTNSYFGKSDDDAVSTAERVKSFQTDEDPSFVELLFQYGQYLLISSSRPGTQVSNLQGIWNKDIEPAWDGAPHLNINHQMNYWPSLSCNLKECQDPLFDYISSLSINGGKTAKVNYEASGWVAHQVSDIWAKTSPDRGEADFLKNKAYPLLEGCTSFLLDWLIEGPGGYLETNPSTSPEHMFVAPDGKPASVSYSSTMDVAIIREVFSEIVSAAEVLGRKNDSLIGKVREAQTKLLPTKITRDGSIMKWVCAQLDPNLC
ncbi:hypothetical protein CRYUN_Cryun04dG0060200 [Craigia yunnanensis]